MLGMHRRWYDGGQGWTLSGEHIWGLTGFQWNTPISWAAWIMGLAQIPFIINFFWSIKHGKKVNDNPWEATTLEWTAPSPPPTEISLRRPSLIGAPTNTACLDATAISRCRTSRLNRLSADGAKLSSNRCSYSLTNGDSIYSLDSTRYRPLEREGRDLVVSRVRSDALRRLH